MESRTDTLGQLAGLAGGRLVGDPGIQVRDVTHDSRQAGPGTLFVAVPGEHRDGHDYVPDAFAAGSPAALVERTVATAIPHILVTSTRRAMAPVAAAVHGNPSKQLAVVGVTGTNGKTTVTHMVESIVETANMSVGLIGTVHTRVGHTNIPNTRTTPESSDFQRLLARMAQMGAKVVSTEVSSHALVMHRVDATRFAVAAFTNLSQDHLDFHGDMDAYFEAKARLFAPEFSDRAVIWIDDPAGRRLLRRLEIPVMTVGEGGDVSAADRKVGLEGSSFVLVAPDGQRRVTLKVGGAFNVDNALVAAGCALSLGLDVDTVAAGLESFAGVPGRFEVVSGDDPLTVIVDYAHTPAGISSVIRSVRETAPGAWVSDGGTRRLFALFGAGGDRDRSKRPQMGEAAVGADVVVVTSDNPRNEDPDRIVDEVMTGIPPGRAVHRITDRKEAINRTISMAGDGDVVLLLGRGHERGQEVEGGRSIPFDDRVVARDALLRSGRRVQ